MATKTIYLTVRLDITNDKADIITDDDIVFVVNETNYQFNSVGDFLIETEICGQNE